MDEQIFEPEPIQTQKRIIIVYKDNDKNYIDGYTMKEIGKSTIVWKGEEYLYDIGISDINNLSSTGEYDIEFRNMKQQQKKLIVEYDPGKHNQYVEELNKMFEEDNKSSESGIRKGF